MQRLRRYIVLVLFATVLVWLSFFSCAGVKINNVDSYYSNDYERSVKVEMQNFAFLVKEFSTTIPDPWCEEDCETVVPLSSASGVVLTADRTSIYVLTAAHFCDPEKINTFFPEDIQIIGYVGEQPRVMEIFGYDDYNDICILKGVKFVNEKYKNIKIADKYPKIGERVINIAAPSGVAGPHIRLMFDGYFGGCDDSCIFTVPATFGSSGSAIFNEDGELITILVAVLHNFDNVSVGPTNDQLRYFILSIDEFVDIYTP